MILSLNSLEQAFFEHYKVVSGENGLRFMVLDPSNISSLCNSLRAALKNAMRRVALDSL